MSSSPRLVNFILNFIVISNKKGADLPLAFLLIPIDPTYSVDTALIIFILKYLHQEARNNIVYCSVYISPT